MPPQTRLSLTEKTGYALGDAASNFYWKTFEFFLLFFYTDVFGLAPAAAGTMFAATRVLDAFTDPLMGMLADRTRTRWGKFRPYVLWFAVPNAVAAVLTFTTPDLDETGKLVYAYITYSLMMLAFTAINIPYSALMGVMTTDARERTSLSSFRFAGAFTAGLVVVMLTKRLVPILGGDDVARGWQLTMACWGLVATVMFLICFRTTRERIQPPAAQQSSLRAELRDLAGNGPWMVLLGLGVLIMTSFWIRSASTMYYFKYVLQREDLFEVFAVSSVVASLAGIALTGTAVRWLGGKKSAYIVLMAAASVLVLAFFVVPPENVAAIFALNLAISVLLGPQSPLLWAMYADSADYSEWRTGRRSTGLIFSAATFGLKIGSAFSGWITGLLLGRFGYVANQVQSEDSVRGIMLLMSIVPGVIGLAAAAIVGCNKLNDRFMAEVERELERRRSIDPVPAP